MAEKLTVIIGAKDEFSKTFGKLKGSLPSLKTAAIASGAAIAGLGTAIFAMTKSTAAAYDNIGKFAGRIGITSEALSKYHHVAELSGITTKSLNVGFQRMTRRIAEANKGVGVAVGALDDLGISIESIAGLSPDQQFEKIAEALSGVSDQGEKVRLAMQFWDTEGVGLLQTLSGGTEGLRAMKEEAEKFGLVVSSTAAKNAAEFNDSLTRLTGSFKGLKNYIAEQFMPIITAMINRWTEFSVGNRDKIIGFGVTTIKVLAKIAEVTAYSVALMVDAWRGLKMTWEILKIAFAEFSRLLLEGFNWIIKKYASVMEALNFKGIFDEPLKSVESFIGKNQEAVSSFEQMGETAWRNLNNIADEGLAIGKVENFVSGVKDAIAEIQAAGGEAASGMPSLSMPGMGPVEDTEGGSIKPPDTSAHDSALAELAESYNQYRFTELERLNQWYSQQQEMFIGNKEAMAQTEFVYSAKKQEILDRENSDLMMAYENLQIMHAEATQTRREQLEEWYAEQLEKFQEFNDAKAMITELYNQKVTELDQAESDSGDAKREKAKKGQTQFFGDMQTISAAFGKKGFKMMQGLSIAEATINAIKAFTTNLGAYPYPLGPILAATALAAGMAQVAAIASQKPPAAHGGLTNVPAEQTYLLDKDERVLSPGQNKDLTEFMGQGGGGGGIGAVTVNITSPKPVEDMSDTDWDIMVEESVIPSLRRLANWGIEA